MNLKEKIRVGIAGGAGYTGGELIRLLINHPYAEIVFVHSRSHAGNPVYAVHEDLFGSCNTTFSYEMKEADVIFLCLPHGESEKFLDEHPFASTTKIIDLSNDYRYREKRADFVYGLSELNKFEISKANKIANPGCFATAIQLALLPLAKAGLLKNEIHINAVTGSTGAGTKLSNSSHFTWRQNNHSAYKSFNHGHLYEVAQTLKKIQANFDQEISFVPNRGNFTRGIYASLYTECVVEEDELQSLYEKYYQSSAFVHLAPFDLSVKQVVNTNNCFLQVRKAGHKVYLTSVIDNLLKGASGQAVQNMNLMFGINETRGLILKPSAY